MIGVILAAALAWPSPEPDIGAKVLDFAESHRGQKVGDGECTTLAREALRHAGARRYRRMSPGADFVWGEPRDSIERAQPGDILQFHDAVFKGRKTLRGGAVKTWTQTFGRHTAIVVRVETTRRGTVLTILQQNAGPDAMSDEQKKVVQQGTINLKELQPGGTVKAFRPVPQADDPPSRAGRRSRSGTVDGPHWPGAVRAARMAFMTRPEPPPSGRRAP
jgi:hypothetical protein